MLWLITLSLPNLFNSCFYYNWKKECGDRKKVSTWKLNVSLEPAFVINPTNDQIAKKIASLLKGVSALWNNMSLLDKWTDRGILRDLVKTGSFEYNLLNYYILKKSALLWLLKRFLLHFIYLKVVRYNAIHSDLFRVES